MILVRMSLLCIAMLVSLQVSAVMRVGNGGDVVYCSPDINSQFSGYYSYDYLATYNLGNGNADLVGIKNIEESMARISQVLGLILPERQIEFDEFVRNSSNFTDRRVSHLWLARPGELIDVPNLPHLRKLPKNCDEIYQAVIRYELGDQIVYEYNPELLKALSTRPIQLSFLMVHEFLWEVYPELATDANASQSRFELTRFLHSQAALDWTPKETWEYVSSLHAIPVGELFKYHLTWGDKYNPPSAVDYFCEGEDWVGSIYKFTIQFRDLNYLGSSGGYFYSQVSLLTLDRVTIRLLSRPTGTEGLYVFEDGFNFQLTSQNPLDGSFENNMSNEMSLSLRRGHGKCKRVMN